MKKLRGLKDLLVEAVEGGATALERLQKDAASTPFRVLEAVPALGPAARVVHTVHDASVSLVYGVVRGVTRAVDAGADVALDVAEQRLAQAQAATSEATPTPPAPAPDAPASDTPTGG